MAIGRIKIIKVESALRQPLFLNKLSDSNNGYYSYMTKNGQETNRGDKESGFYVKWQVTTEGAIPLEYWNINN